MKTQSFGVLLSSRAPHLTGVLGQVVALCRQGRQGACWSPTLDSQPELDSLVHMRVGFPL